MDGEVNGSGSASLQGVRRMRRLRRSEAVRGLVRETVVTPEDFIQPLFITH